VLASSAYYTATAQIMATDDKSNMTGLEIANGATFFVNGSFVGEDKALQVGDLSGSGSISGQAGTGNFRYIEVNQTTDDVVEFSGSFILSSTNGGTTTRSVGLVPMLQMPTWMYREVFCN
jgi:hypothetical protein